MNQKSSVVQILKSAPQVLTSDNLVRSVAIDSVPHDVIPQSETRSCEVECDRAITKEELFGIFEIDGPSALYLFGIFFYDGVFGNPHRTRFWYRLTPLRHSEGSGGVVVTAGWIGSRT